MALGQFPYTEAQNQEDVPTAARLRWVELGSPRGEAERAAQGAQPFFPNWQSRNPCPVRCGGPPRPPGNPQKPPATASSMRPCREGTQAEPLGPRSTEASPSLPGQDPLPPRDQPQCTCALAPSRGGRWDRARPRQLEEGPAPGMFLIPALTSQGGESEADPIADSPRKPSVKPRAHQGQWARSAAVGEDGGEARTRGRRARNSGH